MLENLHIWVTAWLWLKDIENNTMRILHDVATRCMKGYDNPDKVDYVSFTKGNWGATMRYDFAKTLVKQLQ